MGRRVIRFAVYANGSILVRMDENRSEWDDRPVRRPLFVPAGGPPRVNPPSLEIYAAMGEDNIYRMVADFYHELEHSPIRFMFPANMQDAAEKTSAFFVGLLYVKGEVDFLGGMRIVGGISGGRGRVDQRGFRWLLLAMG